MKICKDCKHLDGMTAELLPFSLCGYPSRVSVVTGKSTKECVTERMEGKIISWLEGSCGKAGRYWEEKS